MRKDDAKFFATVPANQVAESHGIPQRVRDTTQYVVPHRVATVIVNRLAEVDVDHDSRDWQFVVDRSSPVFLAAGEERSPIQTLG